MYGIVLHVLSFLGDVWQHNSGSTCPSLPSTTVTCSSFTHTTDVSSLGVQPSLITDWQMPIQQLFDLHWWLIDGCQFIESVGDEMLCQSDGSSLIEDCLTLERRPFKCLIYSSRRYLSIVKIYRMYPWWWEEGTITEAWTTLVCGITLYRIFDDKLQFHSKKNIFVWLIYFLMLNKRLWT